MYRTRLVMLAAVRAGAAQCLRTGLRDLTRPGNPRLQLCKPTWRSDVPLICAGSCSSEHARSGQPRSRHLRSTNSSHGAFLAAGACLRGHQCSPACAPAPWPGGCVNIAAALCVYVHGQTALHRGRTARTGAMLTCVILCVCATLHMPRRCRRCCNQKPCMLLCGFGRSSA